jgi:RNA polymerase sigma-70 factor (ECF subfamily)
MAATTVCAGRVILDSTSVSTLALEKFLAEVEKRAYRMAVIATGNREDALDIVQDSMFKLAERYQKRDAEEWPPLFYRILQSKIRDWYRRTKVKNRVLRFFSVRQNDEGLEEIETIADPVNNQPDQALKNSRAISELDKAVGQLPLRQQQALMLRLWEGLDVKQTAKAMGCSDGSVKTHYSRAVHVLREKLGDHWS